MVLLCPVLLLIITPEHQQFRARLMNPIIRRAPLPAAHLIRALLIGTTSALGSSGTPPSRDAAGAGVAEEASGGNDAILRSKALRLPVVKYKHIQFVPCCCVGFESFLAEGWLAE
jgi:hypothetical protein